MLRICTGSRKRQFLNTATIHLRLLTYGDPVVLSRPNGKKNLVRLKEGGSFTLEGSQIPHSAIVDAGTGAVITAAHTRRNGSTGTRTVRVLEPAFEDFCSLNSRDTTPSYPKDCAAVSLLLGLAPGQSILEAGTGAGGMTAWLSRAVGPSGAVHSVDVRPYAQESAQRELKRFFGKNFNQEHGGNVNFHIGDMCAPPAAGCALEPPRFLPEGLVVHGVVLDMMKPWLALHAATAPLKQGGCMVVFCTNITQAMLVFNTMRSESLPLWLEACVQVSHQEWMMAPPVVRPAGVSPHSGFLLQLRRVSAAVRVGPDGTVVKGEAGAGVTHGTRKGDSLSATGLFDVSMATHGHGGSEAGVAADGATSDNGDAKNRE